MGKYGVYKCKNAKMGKLSFFGRGRSRNPKVTSRIYFFLDIFNFNYKKGFFEARFARCPFKHHSPPAGGGGMEHNEQKGPLA